MHPKLRPHSQVRVILAASGVSLGTLLPLKGYICTKPEPNRYFMSMALPLAV